MSRLAPGFLVDAVVHAMKHVGTFHLPTVEERHGLRVGNVAKVMFDSLDGSAPGERVWYEIVRVLLPGPRYVGRYMTDPPICIDCPAELGFGPEHVIDWAEAPE